MSAAPSFDHEPLLALDGVHVSYGNIAAVKGLTLRVMPGEIVTLIGSNGAGKSTTLRTISGLQRPRRGTITFQGKRIDGLPTHDIVRRGIAQAPEGRRIFPRMSVRENLELGGFLRDDPEGLAADEEHVLTLFPRLRERIEQKAGTLSGGEQQMLAVGRALVRRPKLLLLDELSLGLAPVIVERLLPVVRDYATQEGCAVLLVEQHVGLALDVADRAYVLSYGRISLHRAAAELRGNHELLLASYLGEAAAAEATA
jgi:branched-chain amino acid transport system ATP-binding protein